MLRKTQQPRSPLAAGAILAVSIVPYFLLCLPAIYRRGYPPLDPHWMAMPWLWVFPIFLSAAFDRIPWRSRRIAPIPATPIAAAPSAQPAQPLNYESRTNPSVRFSIPRFWQLFVYAILTAAIDGATMGGGVPRHINLPMDFVFGALFFAPIHLLLTLPVEWISQRIWNRVRTFSFTADDAPTQRIALPLVAFLCAGIALTIMFPSIYSVGAHVLEDIAGRRGADADWNDHRARIYYDSTDPRAASLFADYRIQHHHDPASGLELYSNFNHGFESAYNARIAEKLRADPKPGWASAWIPPADAELVAMFRTTDMTPIITLPHKVNEHITIQSDHSITTPDGVFGGGRPAMIVHVARSRSNANIFYIQLNSDVIYAFAEDGTPLANVSR